MHKLPDLRWEERYAWFRYNADEIFRWTDADFDRRIRKIAEEGATAIITYSCTHFRFSFIPWWDDILRCITRLAEACHRYGIKLVEHSSTNLRYNPLDDADWADLYRDVTLEGSSIDDFPGLREFVVSDPVMDGSPISSWVQIDGATGRPVRSYYHGYALCFNNPDYRRVYFSYLRRVFDTGVDGMMNDDIQYYPGACTCEHCRRLFRAQYGYDLPDPAHWGDFWYHFESPAFIAFLKFRQESTDRFYSDIIELEKSCGVHMLRPNYTSSILDCNWSALPFEHSAKYFTNIFQENNNSSMIRYSYPQFMTESIERHALAERHGVPSMSLFYPRRKDSVYFSWAMSHTWGQMYTGSAEQLDLTALEAPYRAFEKAHLSLLGDHRKVPDLAIYLSVPTRDYQDYSAYMTKGKPRPWSYWLQAACVSGLQTDMVFDTDDLESLKKQKMIVLAGVTMLSDAELERLRAFADGGGKLVLIGDCGTLDETGRVRPAGQAEAALGGNVTRLPHDPEEDAFFWDLTSRRTVGKATYIPFAGNPLPKIRNTRGRTLRALLPGRPAVELPERFLAGVYDVGDRYALHIADTKDLIPEGPCMVGHQDLIPGYCPGDRVDEAFTVTCSLPRKIRTVRLYSPTNEGALTLPVTNADGSAVFTVPAAAFGGYALIELA